jgi:hypothetical protein
MEPNGSISTLWNASVPMFGSGKKREIEWFCFLFGLDQKREMEWKNFGSGHLFHAYGEHTFRI